MFGGIESGGETYAAGLLALMRFLNLNNSKVE